MGWSCSAPVGRVLDALRAFCVASTGQSNVWEEKGARFMFEVDPTETPSGAAYIEILQFETARPTFARPLGKCRITANGDAKGAPAPLARALATIRANARTEARAFLSSHITFTVVGD